ncbi:galactose-1-phosphate uridylyltransferase [Altererythrobacter aquiaggeris]|uniref:galactose-1-phosphate uridylyltransferase n=1 Tax=Aestuarierythrobacter aquiaggeris TaxID=1898396 RepID=UPI00301A50F0
MRDIITLPNPAGGAPVYRRDHRKADGRMLHLYGHKIPDGTALADEAGDVALGGELRHHPLRGEWNIYAAHRQNRTFKPSAAADPLAPSRQGRAATEIPFEDFEIAVFDNKFAGLHPSAQQPEIIGGVDTASATGACEVVVYTPEGSGNLHSIGQARRELLVATWIDRYAALFETGCEYVLPFENRGEEVGVTLHHPHGQIYAFGKVPQVQARAAEAFGAGYDLAAEVTRCMPDYGVAESGGMAAFCPRFARFPYETWLAPFTRREGPWDCTTGEIQGFAHLLGDLTRRYDAFFGRDTAYMLGLHAAPRGGSENFHFTAQFYPLLRGPDRVKYLASVEQHTGVFTVDVMPELAAAALRAV